ncbi:MAG TPA: hypothetical protein VJT85_00865 [Gemmatimonadaceae bacterium]|nr:hypothetical protein [Gemmatimonadaceae bacterium]
MTAEKWPEAETSVEAAPDSLRLPSYQALVEIAQRELERALLEQSRPAMGMHSRPSTAAEDAALQRAVHTICIEARRLDLRAEELLIGIKQGWSQLANLRARQLGDRDGDVLREVVSSSIEVFFETRGSSADERRD